MTLYACTYIHIDSEDVMNEEIIFSVGTHCM